MSKRARPVLKLAIGLGLLIAPAQAADTTLAMFAFQHGDYSSARSGFEKEAKAGDPQAQTKLAEMYEQGLDVPRDFVQAHAWYNIASASGNILARQALGRLESQMDPDWVHEAQGLARTLMAEIGGPQTQVASEDLLGRLSAAYTFGAFSGQPFSESDFQTYRPNATANQMVDDILKYNSIPNRSFDVRASPQVPNAAAVIHQTQRFILYNPTFMAEVDRGSTSSWDAYSIMAHEIGHHLVGHTITSGGSRPNLELEADYFSGGTLERMGASLDQAIAAMNRLGSTSGSSTHPGRSDRVAAITRGWNDAKALRSGVSGQPDSSPASTTGGDTQRSGRSSEISTTGGDITPQLPPISGIASVCFVGHPMYQGCPMMMPMARGGTCACFTPLGMLPGVAR